jgi:simple sugar transport system ATP-binding protein
MRIALHNIHKYYRDVHANDGIHLEIAEGSIHGILGENGAGKSTLMKILAGYVRKSEGTIALNDLPVEYGGPSKATSLGIGMLYQDPLDFPSLTVLENFMVERCRGFFAEEALHRRQLLELAKALGFQLNPNGRVRELTVGERQQLELLRLLALGVEVLILDEPTTGISSIQRRILFAALKKLSHQKKTILLVSHKLKDVETLCDRVTVLRSGRVAGEMDHPFDTNRLLNWMFGSMPAQPPSSQVEPGSPVLIMEGVSGSGGRAGVQACSLSVRKGEVVALAGLAGSGQETFLRLAAGLKQPREGTIRIGDQVMTGKDHHAFKARGVSFIPTARLEEGLIPGLTITEHFALRQQRGIKILWKAAQRMAKERIKRFRILGRPSSKPESLSGGNQQRLLLALIPEDPLILLLENPTRGLDMESIRWVWDHLMSYVTRGTGIIFSSMELEEIIQVADRVVVFFDGAMVKDVRVCDTDLHALGQAMAGRV